MKKALLLNDIVLDVHDSEFPVHEDFEWRDAPDNVAQGWLLVGGQIVPPVQPAPTLSEAKAQVYEQLSAYRYQVETGGFEMSGQMIRTDDRSKTLLAGARTAADAALTAGQEYSINWKTSAGWAVLPAAAIVAMSNMVREFVQGCFDVEKVHYEQISALSSVEAVLAYDFTTGWPG